MEPPADQTGIRSYTLSRIKKKVPELFEQTGAGLVAQKLPGQHLRSSHFRKNIPTSRCFSSMPGFPLNKRRTPLHVTTSTDYPA